MQHCSGQEPLSDGTMPHFPRRKGLQQQHLEAVFDCSSLFGASLHKHGDVRIVKQVEAYVVFGDQPVRNIGTCIYKRIHAQRRCIDDDRVGCHYNIVEVRISDYARSG